MSYPDVRTGFYIGPNLWYDKNLNKQFAALVRLDNEVSIHSRDWPDGAWTNYLVSGTPRTILDLPTAQDDHNSPAIAIDGRGEPHFLTNMHTSETLGYIKGNSVGTISSWAQGVLPGLISGYMLTYPHFVRRNDGTLILIMRSMGYHDNGAYQWWTRGPSATAWTLRGTLWEGRNATPPRSAYMTYMHCDPVTDRIHVAFVWRINEVDGSVTHERVSYIYSDDAITWKSVTGQIMALPITPSNNPSCLTGTHDDVDASGNLWNGGGLCVDQSGYPVFTVARTSGGGQKDLVRWTGSSWLRTNISSLNTAVRPALFLLNGELCMLCTRGNTTDPRRIGFYNLDTMKLINEYGYILNAQDGVYTAAWEPSIDVELLKEKGVVEFMVSYDDKPNVYQINGKRLKATIG